MMCLLLHSKCNCDLLLTIPLVIYDFKKYYAGLKILFLAHSSNGYVAINFLLSAQKFTCPQYARAYPKKYPLDKCHNTFTCPWQFLLVPGYRTSSISSPAMCIFRSLSGSRAMPPRSWPLRVSINIHAQCKTI